MVTCRHAGLRCNSSFALISSSIDNRACAARTVTRGIDPDDGVAGAEHQAIEDAGGNSARVVGRMIRLQTHESRPGNPAVLRKREPLAFSRNQYKISRTANFAHRAADAAYYNQARTDLALQKNAPLRRTANRLVPLSLFPS